MSDAVREKWLPGRISMSLSNQYEWIISVMDPVSRVNFIEIRIPPEQMGLALGHRGDCTCEFALRGTDVIGMRRESKGAEVPFPNRLLFAHPKDDKWEAAVEEVVRPYCRAGWECNAPYDVANSHNYGKRGKEETLVTVRFWRFVPATEEDYQHYRENKV